MGPRRSSDQVAAGRDVGPFSTTTGHPAMRKAELCPPPRLIQLRCERVNLSADEFDDVAVTESCSTPNCGGKCRFS